MQPSAWRILGLNREQRQHTRLDFIFTKSQRAECSGGQAVPGSLLLARPPPSPPGSADAVLIITRMYFRAGYLFSLLMMCKSG